MAEEPVFISGLYRSGTTILTRIIDQSDEISCTYDTIHFLRFSYGKYLPIENRYEELLNDTNKRISSKFNLSFDVSKAISCIKNESKITEATVYNCIMHHFLNNSNNKERWAEKTQVEWESIPDFLNMFPNGKVIHIYRDPRAVLASFKHKTIHTGSMYLDAIFASLAMFNFLQEKKVCNNERVYILKYEDFVGSPERFIKDICNFLNMTYSSKMLDVSSFKDIHGKKFDTNSAFTGQKKSINDSSVGIWKEKLSNIEIYLTEMILKDKMIDFDYSLSGIDLCKEEFLELHSLLHDDFLYKRYKYWLKFGNGQQAYPNKEQAYE